MSNDPRPIGQLDFPFPHTPEDSARDPFAANVWVNTNRVSSDGHVRGITLKHLDPGTKDLSGKWVKVTGMTKLGTRFIFGPFKDPDACKRDVKACLTRDEFDQTNLYEGLDNLVATRLIELGFDPGVWIKDAIDARANYFEDMNAYYTPQGNYIAFGRSVKTEGKDDDMWHLASDNDVAIHETGHYLLDHINKGLSSWSSGEGGAIHEGFGDALASLLARDPEISEDFNAAIGLPDDKKQGLRKVDHNLALKDVSTEVHARGQVYGGFFWSLKNKIESLGKTQDEAADIMLRVLVNHAGFYKTKVPKPADFVKAIIAGAEALDKGKLGRGNGELNVPLEKFREFVTEEAKKRGMITTAKDLEDEPVKHEEYPRQGDSQPFAALGPNVILKPKSTTTVIGGTREEYDQTYKTSDGKEVILIGQGSVVIKDAAGKIMSQSIELKKPGVFGIRKTAFDETRKKTADNALYLARVRAGKELKTAKEALDAIDTRKLKTKDDFAKLNISQKKLLIAKAAVKKLGSITSDQAGLAILPNEKTLSYEFKAGLSIYYVNAVDGKVSPKDDVYWF